ncbi:XTP/dITP diphosphatase [Shouchella clausii]|uniref:XTP/dITP diphosphatase n=1 Tax=Shouchella clausii TaxID=79880 RepID=UPI00270120F3|nr:XTP/dITP diphosphatase [Shouchella clausii]MDO7267642.1 XTP/dITP diphosphatase [Shouchella clausii]MDO7287404.1 XTP/dITP diphosphatase [Shouchella clausii]
MNELVVATKNKGKLADFQTLFTDRYIVKSLYDYPEVPEIIEDGDTFRENAAKKAETLAAYLQKPVIADDSGLLIDALGGKPGVYSARYAGEPKNDQANIDKVLSELDGVPTQKRTARFFCVIALAEPGKETIFAEGACEGRITEKPTGSNGFGYDPIFFVPSHGQTMAELSAGTKNQLSHRARALTALKETIEGVWPK